MGCGMVRCCSSKQKLHTKSITESELVGTSEYVPFNICIVMFYEAQGNEITNNVIFKDNESAINMLKMYKIHAQGVLDTLTFDVSSLKIE